MKKRGFITFVTICLFIFSINVLYAAPRGKIKIKKIIKALKAKGQILVKEFEKHDEWTWVEVDYFDEQYPLTIDVLLDNEDEPSRVVYLVAPSGYNFRGNYFTPRSQNIAHFMREHDYLVIGITFREDHLPLAQVDQSLLTWDLEKHRMDMQKVISAIQHKVHLPYILCGQSSSAVCILEYAANCANPKFEKIVLLDTDSFDPEIQPEKVANAQITYDALGQLIEQGIYANPFTKNLKELVSAAMDSPNTDSGQPRRYPLPGNFTLNGLLHFSLIYTAALPGIHTHITGLPGEWVMVQGAAAGYYEPNPDPLYDNFGLFRTDTQILPIVANETGEGTTPLAFERDIYAILSLNGAYTIDWSGIREKVVMVNGELSSGYQTYYGTQIMEAGNTNVTIHVIPDHGYADLLYGQDAEQNVWPHFLE